MSRRLTDLNVGSLRSTGLRRPRPTSTPGMVTPDAPIIHELSYLQQIPGITPFLTLDIIPDLIYLLKYEGLLDLLAEIYPISKGEGVSLEPVPIPPEVGEARKNQNAIIEAFQLGQLTNAINYILFPGDLPVVDSPEINQIRKQYTEDIYQRGARKLEVLIAASDPAYPASLIFNHSSQDVHRNTYQIEVELILNEPEVVERDDMQCACGKRRIQTVIKQLRRADEPPTVFAYCVSCKRQWQFSSA